MNIEEAFTAYLLAQAGLTALIAGRFFPEEIPQGSDLPSMFWIKVSDTKDHTLTGQSTLERPVYQFTAQASTKAGARAVSDQIKTALQDYQGTMSGVTVQKIELQNEFSSVEKSSDGTTKIHYVDLEYEINFVKE